MSQQAAKKSVKARIIAIVVVVVAVLAVIIGSVVANKVHAGEEGKTTIVKVGVDSDGTRSIRS